MASTGSDAWRSNRSAKLTTPEATCMKLYAETLAAENRRMSFVRTILGDVPADELKRCGAHEHIIIDALTSPRNTRTFSWMTSTRHVWICESFAMPEAAG